MIAGPLACAPHALAHQVKHFKRQYPEVSVDVYVAADVLQYDPPYGDLSLVAVHLEQCHLHSVDTPWCKSWPLKCARTLSMLFHNMHAYVLVNSSGHSYDAVLKFRSDIQHYTLPRIDFPLVEGRLYVPIGKDPGDPHWNDGVSASPTWYRTQSDSVTPGNWGPADENLNDQIAWGTQRTMEKYARAFVGYIQWATSTPVHDTGPEKATYWNAYDQKLDVVRVRGYDYELMQDRHLPNCGRNHL